MDARALKAAITNPHIAWMGAREFRGSSGMTWDTSETKNEAYDFGRDLAHKLTLRRWDECR